MNPLWCLYWSSPREYRRGLGPLEIKVGDVFFFPQKKKASSVSIRAKLYFYLLSMLEYI